MATKQQLAQYCADHFPHYTGIPYMTTAIITAVALVIGYVVGYIGIKSIKTDIANLKTDLTGSKTSAPTPAVPVTATPTA